MEFLKDRDKRKTVGNGAVIAAFIIISLGCWNVYSWYEKVAPLGTVISFLALCIATLCYRNIGELIRDKEFLIVVFGCVVAVINIFVTKSGLGAFFTAADVMLILYLANKIKMSKKCQIALLAYTAFYFYYWTVDVKGYFKGYNTNYGGLVLVTGFICSCILLVWLFEYLQKRDNKKACIAVVVVAVANLILGYEIIAWYRARCALLGLILVTLFIIIPGKVWKKLLYNIMMTCLVFGLVLGTFFYMFLGAISDYITVQIFYKDIVSGREQLWSELWWAYLNHPITGIGSSYTIMHVDWMNGMFEVHNGLLDILVVHGIVVFIVVVILLLKRLFEIRTGIVKSAVSKAAMAGIIAMLSSSFLENFFIVPPFLLVFLLLFIVAGANEDT